MTFSLKRFNAIFIKELQDFKSNISYLCICLMPVVFSIIFKINFSNSSETPNYAMKYLLVVTTLMGISLIGVAQSAGTFAEEKEKHTLKVLMLSPISELEVLLGKTLMTFLLIIISSLANLFILNPGDINILMYIIIVSLAGYGSILFGIAIGMLAPSEKASGVLSLPAVFIYLAPIFFTDTNNVIIKKIVSILPAYSMESILLPEALSNNANSIFLSILYLVMWLVFGFIFFIVIYRKKKLK
ncbi:ABC transporter permease [Oceanirhabdus seepicola]|uniref:ABC transporter permease n=1 Tax=Oceanirhabdus seepicola TaxID=2828781 RepID=A0A9J6P0S7_9CLOT|nr:ABC transporter permease [Oceanirhabdus seepicola]MCM1989064.1 ABC transporter permease [Oceanirhabdus seepicola]